MARDLRGGNGKDPGNTCKENSVRPPSLLNRMSVRARACPKKAAEALTWSQSFDARSSVFEKVCSRHTHLCVFNERATCAVGDAQLGRTDPRWGVCVGGGWGMGEVQTHGALHWALSCEKCTAPSIARQKEYHVALARLWRRLQHEGLRAVLHCLAARTRGVNAGTAQASQRQPSRTMCTDHLHVYEEDGAHVGRVDAAVLRGPDVYLGITGAPRTPLHHSP